MVYGYGMTYMIGSQILFFIITVSLIIWVLKDSKKKENYTAKDILDRRLASGEIEKKEYNQLLDTIQS
ncbi:MAG: hypothetical protein KAR23_03820 [Candidatus Aenigmarchaeota archaeon]|nr:hypothetical protein [Candidatus Aenigmarchaeota archaeon]